MEEPDPTTHLDKIVVAVIGIGGAMMLLGNIVILCYRSYRPIMSKSVLLTLLSSVGGLIWIVSAIVVNDHFARKRGSLLAVCVLWTYWFQACFGFALWLNCLTLRLITLYRIFICKRDTRTYDYAILLLLLLPVIIFCIVASADHNSIHFKEVSELGPGPAPSGKGARGYCHFEPNSWARGLLVLLAIYFFIFLGFAFKLRNTMAQFNEFRLIRRGGILSLFSFLLSLVTLTTRAYDKPVGRCFLSAAVASAIFYYFWARNGVVIYNVLFNREKYLERFNADVRRLPSHQHERQRSSGNNLNMMARLMEVRAELQNCQDKIKQLEDELKILELDNGARQQETSSQSSP